MEQQDSQSLVLTREELYELVWSTPMSQLARSFSLSDVGLAKVCDRHNIPRPPRGHWAKLTFGKAGQRPPLPPCDDPALQRVTLRAQLMGNGKTQPEKSDDAGGAEARPLERIRVSEHLTEPHPLIERTLRSLEAARPGESGLVRPRASRCFAVAVAPSSVERAVRILDALVKSLERQGYVVSAAVEAGRATEVTLLDEKVGVLLEEHLDRRERPPAAPGPRERHQFSFVKSPRVEYDFEPSGRLALRIDGTARNGYRRTWSDGQRPLEAQLNGFVAGLVRALQCEKAYRKQQEILQKNREEAERLRQLEERRQQEVEQLRQEEQARAVHLNRAVASWEEASRLRAFASAARQAAAARGEMVTPGSPLARWLEWAELRAQMIDPVTSPHSRLQWPPSEGSTIKIKVDGPYSWSASRKVRVLLSVPPPCPTTTAGPTTETEPG